MTCEKTLPPPYQDMTPEQALEECFKVMLSKYGETKHKLATSRQTTEKVLGEVAGLNEDQAKKTLREILQVLLDMFDIAEMQLDHVHDAKLIYEVYKRSVKYAGERTQ